MMDDDIFQELPIKIVETQDITDIEEIEERAIKVNNQYFYPIISTNLFRTFNELPGVRPSASKHTERYLGQFIYSFKALCKFFAPSEYASAAKAPVLPEELLVFNSNVRMAAVYGAIIAKYPKLQATEATKSLEEIIQYAVDYPSLGLGPIATEYNAVHSIISQLNSANGISVSEKDLHRRISSILIHAGFVKDKVPVQKGFDYGANYSLKFTPRRMKINVWQSGAQNPMYSYEARLYDAIEHFELNETRKEMNFPPSKSDIAKHVSHVFQSFYTYSGNKISMSPRLSETTYAIIYEHSRILNEEHPDADQKDVEARWRKYKIEEPQWVDACTITIDYRDIELYNRVESPTSANQIRKAEKEQRIKDFPLVALATLILTVERDGIDINKPWKRRTLDIKGEAFKLLRNEGWIMRHGERYKLPLKFRNMYKTKRDEVLAEYNQILERNAKIQEERQAKKEAYENRPKMSKGELKAAQQRRRESYAKTEEDFSVYACTSFSLF